MRAIAAPLLLFAAGAVQAGPSAGTCSDPAARQFDFWLGDWQVRSEDGKTVLGRSHVESVLGGCALQEHWRGARGAEGMSLSWYEAGSGRWHQRWIDSSGSTLQLDGGRVGNALVLEAVHGSGDATVTERISWTPLADGRVRQRWETIPAGKPPTVSFDGWYQRPRDRKHD